MITIITIIVIIIITIIIIIIIRIKNKIIKNIIIKFINQHELLLHPTSQMTNGGQLILPAPPWQGAKNSRGASHPVLESEIQRPTCIKTGGHVAAARRVEFMATKFNSLKIYNEGRGFPLPFKP